jgi:hypothetical protein
MYIHGPTVAECDCPLYYGHPVARTWKPCDDCPLRSRSYQEWKDKIDPYHERYSARRLAAHVKSAARSNHERARREYRRKLVEAEASHAAGLALYTAAARSRCPIRRAFAAAGFPISPHWPPTKGVCYEFSKDVTRRP